MYFLTSSPPATSAGPPPTTSAASSARINVGWGKSSSTSPSSSPSSRRLILLNNLGYKRYLHHHTLGAFESHLLHGLGSGADGLLGRCRDANSDIGADVLVVAVGIVRRIRLGRGGANDGIASLGTNGCLGGGRGPPPSPAADAAAAVIIPSATNNRGTSLGDAADTSGATLLAIHLSLYLHVRRLVAGIVVGIDPTPGGDLGISMRLILPGGAGGNVGFGLGVGCFLHGRAAGCFDNVV